MKNKSIVITRQQPLIENYFISPEEAWVTDVAIVEGKNISDPFHTSVSINEELKTAFPVGVIELLEVCIMHQILEIYFVLH